MLRCTKGFVLNIWTGRFSLYPPSLAACDTQRSRLHRHRRSSKDQSSWSDCCFLEAFSSPAYLQRQFQFSWEIQRGPWQTGMKLARLYIQIVKTFSGLSLETWVHYKGFKTKEGKGSQRGMGQKETEQGTVRASHRASASDISWETAEWKVLLLEIKVKAEIKTYKWVKDK